MTADLMLYNVIIFGETSYPWSNPIQPRARCRRESRNRQLKRFLEAGGGAWFCGLGEHTYGRSFHGLNYILKEIGADANVINEVVVLDKVAKPKLGGGHAWVQVTADRLTQGVKHLLHPHSFPMDFGNMVVAPIVKLSPQWRILVRGEKKAIPIPWIPVTNTARRF